MGGTQQVNATIRSISATSISVKYVVWDHFGAGGVSDANSSLPGLPELYWLQRNGSNPDKYKPFIWNVKVIRE